MSELTSSEITSISAVVVALAALATAIWQAFLTRKHNRLSVTPSVTTASRLIKGDSIKLCIENNGIGPAIINSVKISHKEKEFKIERYEDLKAFFISFDINLDVVNHIATLPTSPATLAHGQAITFFDILDSKNDSELHSKLKEIIESMKIEIDYKCIYGIRYTTSTQA